MSYRLCLPRLALSALALAATASATALASGADETAHTAAAVIAVDHHWLIAEETGDSAWLDGMLLPTYRSVGVRGTFATKAVIVAHAKTNRGSQAMKRQADAWQKAHPVEQQVTMQGDTAILSFVSTAPATKGKLYSSDIFVYVGGRWRGLISQHTELGG